MTDTPPIAVPNLAATVLLLRQSDSGPEVFMVVRHGDIAFAGGALVFPGGRLDAGDRDLAASLGLAGDAGALRICALRETFEEAAILLARGPVPRTAASWQSKLCADEISFAALLEGLGVEPAPDALVHFAHWITPPNRPKRFDTHFFLAVAPEDQEAAHDGGEAVDSVWISPRLALSEADAGKRKLVVATRLNLMRLARFDSVDAILAHAEDTPVVTIEPRSKQVPEGRLMTLPLAAGYGVTSFLSTDPASI
ncbi:NUDIX hydrolase [Plastoroseomonas arctica]|uniref:NUDIX domain-containing protein n=1 Tax=Plastoroseomonas arctica TaxID=1509237 RepID=A0AAF1JZS3_9PROT|nr:NUDIX domain-containing protein [Plastoroseomonas arctica]MBR0657100.1 NUDIX domain-containing protein [Plastoroseomonas arctica]